MMPERHRPNKERKPGGEHASPPPSNVLEDEISLLEIVNLLLRHLYRLLGFSLAFGVLALLFSLLRPAEYVATASFVPQGSDSQVGRLATLAGRFGVAVPSSEAPGESLAFYAELLLSREILYEVAAERYDLTDGSTASGDRKRVSSTLPELLNIHEDTPELEIAEAIEWLREDAVQIRTDVETGIVGLSVTSRRPELSHAIASQLVNLVNEFNLQTRQSRAAAERKFIEGRLTEGNHSLLAAEGRLEGFLQSNRQFQNSPELLFQHDRLQRRVVRAQEVVTSLSQAHEEARVSEVRNTPVITVVERPVPPLRRESRGIPLMVALGFLLGGTVGVFSAFGSELMQREKERESEIYVEFSTLWTKTWLDIRTLGGRRS